MKTKLLTLLFIVFTTTTLKAQVYTAGTLTVTFTEVVKTGCFGGGANHELAAWIQLNDSFYKTKMRYCCTGTTGYYLNSWGVDAGATWVAAVNAYDATTGNVTDAMTGGTLTSFATRSFTWDGTDFNGTLLADGFFQLKIETTWNTGTATATRFLAFIKNATGTSQTGATAPNDDNQIKNISIVWTPNTMATGQFADNPAVTIYPNPSNTGVFNLAFSNEVATIKIVDMLGKIVYQEKTTNTTGTTKNIDLSNLNNGFYFVNLTNDKGSSNYKIILNK